MHLKNSVKVTHSAECASIQSDKDCVIYVVFYGSVTFHRRRGISPRNEQGRQQCVTQWTRWKGGIAVMWNVQFPKRALEMSSDARKRIVNELYASFWKGRFAVFSKTTAVSSDFKQFSIFLTKDWGQVRFWGCFIYLSMSLRVFKLVYRRHLENFRIGQFWHNFTYKIRTKQFSRLLTAEEHPSWIWSLKVQPASSL